MVKEKIELIYMRKSTKMRLEIKNENLFIYIYVFKVDAYERGYASCPYCRRAGGSEKRFDLI